MNKDEMFNVLYGKDKKDVYREFQSVENDIEENDFLYKYFDEIIKMLLSGQSYIRVRGFRVICRLAKWDKENKINVNIHTILNELADDKPTAVRQCLKVLKWLLLYKPEICDKVKEKLKEIDYMKYKDSMSGLIKKDIDSILDSI